MTATKSIMKMLFDTMPLAGVKGAFPRMRKDKSRTSWSEARVADVAANLALVDWRTVKVEPEGTPGPLSFKDFTELWAYEQTKSPATIENINCRVRAMDYAVFRALDTIEFGSAHVSDPAKLSKPDEFKASIAVTIRGAVYDLPLTDQFLLATFTTKGGRSGLDTYWPMGWFHDRSVVHAFVFDVDLTGLWRNTPKPLSATAKQDFRKRFDHAKMLSDDETLASEYLFQDKLWDESTLPSPATGTVPEDVPLRSRVVRVLVACTFTVCRENLDFFPGDAVGVARLFPHIMVASTTPADYIEAGVRFTRPATTQQIHTAGKHVMSMDMDGMQKDIGGILIADSNEGNMMLEAPFAPPTIWANLFNYYDEDPARSSLLKGMAFPAVYHDAEPEKSAPKPRYSYGQVERDVSDIAQQVGKVGTPIAFLWTNHATVKKVSRQGFYDNLHLAPRMAKPINAKIDHAEVVRAPKGGSTGRVNFGPGATIDWGLDDLPMAPFCIHDCSHIHWRWPDHQNNQPAAWGFGGKANRTPNSVAGAVLIPGNHSASIVILDQNSFEYLGQARRCSGEWEIFCHHGAGYGVGTNPAVVNAALSGIPFVAGTKFFKSASDQVDDAWWLFYWCNRYCLSATTGGNATLVERFRWKSQAGRRKVLEL